MRSVLLSCWSGLSKEVPKHTSYCYCHWFPPEVEGKWILLKIPCTSEMGPRGLWAANDLKAPSLSISTVSGSSMKTSKAGRQPAVLPNYDTYKSPQQPAWHANLRVQEWQSYLAGNKQLSNYDLFNKMGTMSSNGNLVNYTGLMKSYILEEKLQTSLF